MNSTINSSAGISYNSAASPWLSITDPIDYTNYGTITAAGTSTLITTPLTINNSSIMQNKVAVFKVTRDENQKITSTKFIKELWIESKNGSSVDFEVAKDPEISNYKADEIIIRNVYTLTF